MNWDLFRFSLAKKLFLLLYKDYEFTEWGNDWGKQWRFLWELRSGDAPVGPQGRLCTLSQLLKLTAGVEGDMVECGAYRGVSSKVILVHSPVHSSVKRLHVFDSFEGLSEPSPKEKLWWKHREFSASVKEFEKAVWKYRHRYVIHKGWIPSRFPEVVDLPFSFVHVDVDLAEPTRECIEFFYPRLSPGGIMVFDDYGYRQCREVKRVVDEAFPASAIIKLTTGQAFVMKGGKDEQNL